MFGEGFICPKKPEPRVKPKPTPLDINYPCPKPYCYAHMGREANTNYHVRIMQYKQQQTTSGDAYIEGEKQRLSKDIVTIKYDTHAEKKRFQKQIKDRYDIKLKEYEEAIDKRRDKLQQLFAKEEREFVGETVDKAQRGGETKVDEMKRKAQLLKAKREDERLKVVEQKRIEQYVNRCDDLRRAVIKKNVMEARNGQLQQIRENEARREVEREEDKMWFNVMMKEVEAKMEREEQEALDRKERDRLATEVLDIQVQGLKLLKVEEAKVAEEDRVEMEKLREKMRREEIEVLDAKRRKRDQFQIELQEQIEMQEKFLAQRKKEEEALETAFNMLAEMEIAKEKAKIQDLTSVAKKEIAQYKAHLAELEEERKHEEKELTDLLEVHRKAIMKKQEEAQCKMQMAKQQLLKSVLEGRAEQLEIKKQKAEQQLKFKEAENELMRMACETNDRLRAEQKRAQASAAKQYREDLLKQIEYNNTLRERERQELERQLAQGLKEEEKYRQVVNDLISGKLSSGGKHPFRRTLERYDCHCQPEYSVKPKY